MKDTLAEFIIEDEIDLLSLPPLPEEERKKIAEDYWEYLHEQA